MTIRRHGQAAREARRYRLRHGVYAVIRAGGGVLLTVQAGGEEEPELLLPGGGVDPGEQPLAALHREVMEETGWALAAPRRVGAFRIFRRVPADAWGDGPASGRVWAEKVCTVYAARAARRLGPPLEPGHAAVVLSAGDARLALANPGERAMLDLALGRGGARPSR